MLTIVQPVYPNTWMLVECECDCGNYIVLPYQRVYNRQFSCGCKRRSRSDMEDYTGYETFNQAGNEGMGRRLTVLGRGDRGRWLYVCDCCATVTELLRGGERGLQRYLHDVAGNICPNYLRFYAVERMSSRLPSDYFAAFDTRLYRALGLRQLAIDNRLHDEAVAMFYTPDRVLRDSAGKLKGVFGLPNRPLPRRDSEDEVEHGLIDWLLEEVQRDPLGFARIAPLFEQFKEYRYNPRDFMGDGPCSPKRTGNMLVVPVVMPVVPQRNREQVPEDPEGFGTMQDPFGK